MPNRFCVQSYDRSVFVEGWFPTEETANVVAAEQANLTGCSVFVWERWPDGWLGKLSEFEPGNTYAALEQ